MSKRDEEMQESVEKGELKTTDNLDGLAYREIFRILKKDPEYELPSHFAERVAFKVARRRSRSLNDYVWFGAGILALLFAFAGTMFFTGITLDLGFLAVISDYRDPLLFGVLFVTFLSWLDRRLVQRRIRQFGKPV